MDLKSLNEKFQENLIKNLKDVCFTYVVKNKLPREISMSVADTFIRSVMEHKSIPEFNITPVHQGSVILFSIETINKEILATVLIKIDVEDNLITIKEIVSTIKDNF